MSRPGDILRAYSASKLGRRFMVGLFVSLTLTSLIFMAVFVTAYRTRLIAEHTRASTQVNSLLEAALKNAMLKRDLDGLRAIIAELGTQHEIVSVMILNPDGQIRFSTDAARVGAAFAAVQTEPTEILKPSAAFTTAPGAVEVLRTINPVHNEARCGLCHGPAAIHPINGVLVVDYAAHQIRQDAWNGTLAMAGSGFGVLLAALLSLAALLYRYILKPVNELTSATARFAGGDFSSRVNAGSSDDELAVLANRFNLMADRIGQMFATVKSSEGFLQTVIDSVPDGVRVIADDYTILKVNQAYCRQLGIAPAAAIGQKCHVSSHHLAEPCSPTLVTCPLVELAQADDTPLKCRHRHVQKDGTELFVEVIAARAEIVIDGERRNCVIESIRDLADQASISHEQRLSEIGLLATGIAHEIHNPLSSIHLALRAMQEEITRAAPAAAVQQYLDIADREIDRCIDVTKRLLRISEPASPDLVLTDVRHMLDDVGALIAYQAEQAGVKIVTDVRGTPRILASESDLGIVILNLCQNAIHAMPQGGTLTLSAAEAGGTVKISFADTGVGIAPENLQRIFWPFWSRRADGSLGTGLGLSICRATVERLGGNMAVQSMLGKGTTFHVAIPSADHMVIET